MTNLKTLGHAFLLTTTLISVNAFANNPNSAIMGGTSSGGGQGIVCRNDDGTVASAKLLDLAEAQDYFLLTLQPQPANRPYLDIAHDYAAILESAMPSVLPTSKETSQNGTQPPQISYDLDPGALLTKQNKYAFITTLVNQIDMGKMIIPGNDFKLPPVGDSTPLVLPSAKNCSIEQIAVYTDGDDQVHFVGGIWDQLDNVNKAALLIHEALYRTMRQLGDTTSDYTRKANGYLFGGMQYQWILQGLPQDYLSCWTTDANASYQFVVYPNDTTSVTAQFLVYNGQIMLTNTTTVLNLAPFANVFGLKASPVFDEVESETLSNPLLSAPTYNFGMDDETGTMKIWFNEVTLVGGTNQNWVTCKDHLSTVTYTSNGVGVGPAGALNPTQ